MKLSGVIPKIYRILKKENVIKVARIYGSSLYLDDNVIDVDIAVMVPAVCGIVKHPVYKRLVKLRRRLCTCCGVDIDLIPHTLDEVIDNNSPLWHPRYNPSLVFGRDIKGNFPLRRRYPVRSYVKSLADYASFILHDTRTITRRQAIRSLRGEEARIFLAKITHGPGNALTYLALRKQKQYRIDPSDIKQAFNVFDALYKFDSRNIQLYLDRSKEIIAQKGYLPLARALNILSWYELLVSVVLKFDPPVPRRFLRTLAKTNNWLYKIYG